MGGTRAGRTATVAAAAVLLAGWVVGVPAGGAVEYDGTSLNRVLAAHLTGAAEVDGGGNPNQGDPDGVGLASVVLEAGPGPEAAGSDVCARLIVTGIDTVTMAHIHVGAAGTNGPVVVPLPAPTSGASGACVEVDPVLLEAISTNPAGYYVNVHTVAFPAGALRGQLAVGASPLTASLSGASEVTAGGVGFQGDVDGVGQAVVLVDPLGTVCVAVTVADIDPPSAGHIHQAALRANGPVVVPFSQLPTGGSSVECIAVDPTLAGTIASAPAGFYVNLHNGAFPAGAVRGQLGRGFTSGRLVQSDGSILHLVDANDAGSAEGVPLAAPVVDADTTPTGRGYWLTATDGGVFTYGDAGFHGSTGGIRLNAPVVGVSGTPTADGYWLAATDGGVFTFGDAGFFGSAGGVKLNAAVVGIASTPTGRGYWLVASDGGVFTYGDAGFFGSAGGVKLNAPVVGIAATPTGDGYWLLGADGGIFTYGDAAFLGSTSPEGGPAQMVDLVALPVGAGYRQAGRVGETAAFGEAPSLGVLVDPGEPDLLVVAVTR